MYSHGVVLDIFEEGSIITLPNSSDILCLGKFEIELLNNIIAHGLSETISFSKEMYTGENIEMDIYDFCHELVDKGVICET